ncbi:GNAT family N-acetyltransferase [Sphingomonas sp. 28-63-12]|uniref:GNAT family N-acetyltransferase n=1 Tax=Sphingomonas sp. 28-63-12 TaxID=1970434 RepID=UPI000BD34418|nr:MAG: GNAT family N-acetyltransferase [Sphingomonas sp. 28-63-12]
MSDPPVIDGARVRLRPLVAGDAVALHAIYSDVEAMTWWSHAPHERLEETEAKLAKNLVAPDWRAWAITLVDDDTAIGSIAAHEKRQGKVAEIGYSLVRSHWGQGFARESVSLLISFLFEVEGYRRIFADTDPDNAESNGLLTRLGFTLEGRMRSEWETHIGVRDSFIWGLLADEWRA